MKARYRIALAVTVVLSAAAALGWLAKRAPGINFLPADSRAEWIIFPTAVDVSSHSIASLDVTFRRDFTVESLPRTALLSVRAAKRLDLKINGVDVEVPETRNWKQIADVRIERLLRVGDNTIEGRVFNDNAPPALWLSLKSDNIVLQSDASWHAFFAGSSWRAAAPASQSRLPGAGNPIASSETSLAAFARIWPLWIAFATLALAVLITGRIWFDRASMRVRTTFLPLTAMLLAVCWLVLFYHNTPLLPFHVGFDAQAHADYIKYLQDRRALPLPKDGLEMFQPPLFYAASAAILSAAQTTADTAAAIWLVRGFTMLAGVAHFLVVGLTVRLLFPARWGAQLVALGFAALLPMQVYLSHFCTNETLAALLVSAAVYQTVRIVVRDRLSWSAAILLGITLGAAALTKVTAFLVAPIIVMALAAHIGRTRTTSVRVALQLLAIPLLTTTLAAWHYIRIWNATGALVIGGWDPASGFRWWQDDGYRTFPYFLRFGRALFHPLFAATASFWDGIYATFWGDGLCAGVPDLAARLPWNYDLMNAGYLLAIVPTALLIAGAVTGFVRLIREGWAAIFLIIATAFVIGCGVLYLNLNVPAYASVKAFYALPALTALAVFVALGWEAVTRSSIILQIAFGALLAVWAMNSFASFWVLDSAQEHLWLGLSKMTARGAAAGVSDFEIAFRRDPGDARGEVLLAAALDASGRTAEAVEHARRAVTREPANAGARLQLASCFGRAGDCEGTSQASRRALERGGESVAAWKLLSFCLLQSHSTEEAIMAAQDGLAVSPFTADLHFNLAAAFAAKGEYANAAAQFAYAQLLRPDLEQIVERLRDALAAAGSTPGALKQLAQIAPDSAILLGNLAWLMATNRGDGLRDGAMAERLARRACTLTSYNDPELLVCWSVAQAEEGRFNDAIATGEKALAIARSRQANAVVELTEEALRAFRAGERFRGGRQLGR